MKLFVTSLLALGLSLAYSGPTTARAARPQVPAYVPAPQYQYLQMTTIESVVAGGMGRSRILFTPEFKGTKEANMENLFSLTGLNLGNVHANEETIMRYLNELAADGWELMQTTPLTQTLVSGGTTGQGIFLTRYLFRKAK
ncbi:DUF4177 domain-containing protein [Hymenobacter guriensis]|uniref:DUF4177 domain-containing protein n=1 Tax=Hymenobacter guriensis TaxID=2793065 RepID=A0ABS0KZY7_9BACT|nr:DUF4177 domain-containing protein [Hymenobacter guriensis]MBG8553416.1 hypothetical protein [Hymenobacter guriensis]